MFFAKTPSIFQKPSLNMIEKLNSSSARFEARVFKKKSSTFTSMFSPLYFRIYDIAIALCKEPDFKNCKVALFSEINVLTYEYEEIEHSSKITAMKIKGFTIANEVKAIEFTSSNRDDLAQIIQILKRKVNLNGFDKDYLRIKQIGEGNFAKVFLIKNHRNNQYYAGKIVDKSQSKRRKLALETEIDILRKVDHNNLIKLISVYDEDDHYILIFELFSYGSLKDYILKRGLFNETKAALIAKSVLQGLKHLHSLNIMHRDVKPENILLKSSKICEKNVVLADFGLATSNSVDEYIYHRCGSPGYVAPEVLSLKDPKGHYNLSCDLFSLGVTLYFMMTGKMPYSTYKNQTKKLYKINLQKNTEFSALSPSAQDLISKLVCFEDSRISLEKALEHDFLNEKAIESQEDLEDTPFSDCEDTLPSTNLKEFNKRKINLEEKNITSFSPCHSPFTRAARVSLSFVCQTPLLNGFVNTIETLDQGNPEDSFGRIL